MAQLFNAIGSKGPPFSTTALENALRGALIRTQDDAAAAQLRPTVKWSKSPTLKKVPPAKRGNDLVASNEIRDKRYVYNDEGTGIYVGRPVIHKPFLMPIMAYARKTTPGSLTPTMAKQPFTIKGKKRLWLCTFKIKGIPTAGWSTLAAEEVRPLLVMRFSEVARRFRL